tara:strand:- start:51541 stop:52212 length:672 start_codon:yes stop_codon:yes gene_type:complete
MSQEVRHTEQWELADVKPYKNNAKIHDPASVTKLAMAIKELGFDVPIVVDGDGVIIKGHGRRLAAMELGMKYVPVIVRDDMTPEKAKAARLSDNRVAEGENNLELLQSELAGLADEDIDLGMIGFDERELAFLTEDIGEFNLDATITDLDSEVTEQADLAAEKANNVGNRFISLREAFGFNEVTVDQSRVINAFMAQAEEDSGKEGAPAFIAKISQLVIAKDK